jgi:hypothetical protein
LRAENYGHNHLTSKPSRSDVWKTLGQVGRGVRAENHA